MKGNIDVKVYSIFDDFDNDSIQRLVASEFEITLHESGKMRPSEEELIEILRNYDCIIVGTSQKISEVMFESINDRKIIATISSGIDHIKIPVDKYELITVINTPNANVQSVAEYTIGCILCAAKRLKEGNILFEKGKTKKFLTNSPQELYGKKIGIVGAGTISQKIMEYAQFFGMKIYCWTKHPEKYRDLEKKGVFFTSLEEIAEKCSIISVNLPNVSETRGIISKRLIKKMKNDTIFISISRIEVLEWKALIKRAIDSSSFYVNLDVDVFDELVNEIQNINNVVITPHIAGESVESRKKKFSEITEALLEMK